VRGYQADQSQCLPSALPRRVASSVEHASRRRGINRPYAGLMNGVQTALFIDKNMTARMVIQEIKNTHTIYRPFKFINMFLYFLQRQALVNIVLVV